MSAVAAFEMKAPRDHSGLREQLAGYGFLAPWLIGFFALTLGLALASLYFSMTDYSGMLAPNLVDADNYLRIATEDPRFWTAMNVTFTFVLLSAPLKWLFALAVAVALNKGLRGLSLCRAIFYLRHSSAAASQLRCSGGKSSPATACSIRR